MDVVMKINQFNSFVGAFLIALVTLVLMGCTDSETPSAIRTVSLQLASDVIGNSIADHEVTSIHIDQKPVANDDLELLRDNRIITTLL